MARTSAGTRGNAYGQATGMIVAATYVRNNSTSRSSAGTRTNA